MGVGKIIELILLKARESFLQKIPLKRFGKASDTAYAIAFLLSDYSEYITGEVLKVNGGMYM